MMIKTGIIGCGKVAHLHAQALQNLENSDFTAVFSRTIDKAIAFGNQYSAKGYDSIPEMVNEEKIDLVIICTPHPNHLDPTSEAIEAGVHALVEKPLASILEDCDTMIRIAKQYHKNLELSASLDGMSP